MYSHTRLYCTLISSISVIMIAIEVLCCEEQFFFFSQRTKEKNMAAPCLCSLKITFLLIRFYENKWLEYFFLYSGPDGAE